MFSRWRKWSKTLSIFAWFVLMVILGIGTSQIEMTRWFFEGGSRRNDIIQSFTENQGHSGNSGTKTLRSHSTLIFILIRFSARNPGRTAWFGYCCTWKPLETSTPNIRRYVFSSNILRIFYSSLRIRIPRGCYQSIRQVSDWRWSLCSNLKFSFCNLSSPTISCLQYLDTAVYPCSAKKRHKFCWWFIVSFQSVLCEDNCFSNLSSISYQCRFTQASVAGSIKGQLHCNFIVHLLLKVTYWSRSWKKFVHFKNSVKTMWK